MASNINSDNGVVSGSAGLKYASDNSGVLALQTNGNTAITIDSTGLVTLPYGQIKFPATQVASTDPNTLDDYEEGTFTPTLTFGGSSTGITYSARQGSYTKIGNMVYFNIFIGLSNKGSSTGSLWVTGMPFPYNGTLNANGVYPIVASLYQGSSVPSGLWGGVYLSNVYLYYVYSSGYTNAGDTIITNSSQIQFAGCYQTT